MFILQKIGIKGFREQININIKHFENNLEKDLTKEEKTYKYQGFYAFEAGTYIIDNMSMDIRTDVYLFLEKSTGFSPDDLKKMSTNEVFSLIREVFKDGIPDMIMSNLKKTL